MESDADFIRELLAEAGERALGYFRRVEPERQAWRSGVTEADLSVQRLLAARLRARFPDDGILAEEECLHLVPVSGDRRWIVDPIDGTSSFVAGLPVWGIGLALLEGGHAVEGYFLMPTTGDYFHTVPGGGVERNGEAVRIKPPEPLHSDSLLLASSGLHRGRGVSPAYRGKVRSLGSTIAHMCWVATGSADVALLDHPCIWDLAPGIAMLSRAGGVLRYLHGEPVDLSCLMDGRPAARRMICGDPETVVRVEGSFARPRP